MLYILCVREQTQLIHIFNYIYVKIEFCILLSVELSWNFIRSQEMGFRFKASKHSRGVEDDDDDDDGDDVFDEISPPS